MTLYKLCTALLVASASSFATSQVDPLEQYKAAHPERFQGMLAHPVHTAVEIAAYKVAHPERFEGRPQHSADHLEWHHAEYHRHNIAEDIAMSKAAHPERFDHSSEEHHQYSAEELTVFKAGMAHAEHVAQYKAAHPDEITPEAIAAYKTAHPERFNHSMVSASTDYSEAELNVFRAGFEHFEQYVAPYKAAHPEMFSPEAIAAYKAAHPERFP